MKEINLVNFGVALVDDDDFEYLNQFKWYATLTSKYYVKGRVNGVEFWMHRLIMDAQEHQEVDHKDNDGFNNQKTNLRFATKSQNAANRKKSSLSSSSKFKGVCWASSKNKWVAKIKIDGYTINLGAFDLEEDAARAYDKLCLKHFGEFAQLNFPT